MSMMDFPGGEEMSMNNDDLENNYNVGVQPSRNVVEENRVHGWCLLPKRTYDSIKQNEDESWREIIDDHTLYQKSPGGNTVLHVAALYGNDRCVERIVEIGGAELLTAINRNGDTPLHVAARAGKISTLHMLVAALLPNPNSEQAKEAILVTNNQGNTLFHEALLNGHKNVMEILNSSPGFRELVEETAFTIKNNEDKSVLHLALEKSYEDILVQVLFSRTVLPIIQGDDENEDEDEEKEEEEEEDKDGLEAVEFKVFEGGYEDIADVVLTRIIPGMEVSFRSDFDFDFGYEDEDEQKSG
ncbi:hypothetical protein VNO80_26654 [Phaseolus coccineus]|uniref:Ankyrin repeat-containing protein n=1 Tax=Phaseolus coccineus TaxID=3886 RepID=A0AAN9LIV8_PHACN